MYQPLIVIPARLSSSRLPHKPLADIHGSPMIIWVMRRAQAANVGRVVVACADTEIYDCVKAHGGEAVMTDPNLPSGTDRVFAALSAIDASENYEIILNLQGDMPTIDPELISDVLTSAQTLDEADIVTAIVKTRVARDIEDPNVVKAVVTEPQPIFTGQPTPVCARALYFSRAQVPHGASHVWHHVGLYAYRRQALQNFCALPPSPLELQERLEQLRALEHNMSIYAVITHSAPDGVDTPDDLERARAVLQDEAR